VSGIGGTPSTSLTPGIVTTGFSLYILPKIQGNDVFLQITSSLSSDLTFSRQSSGSGTTGSQATIQLPKVSEKRFNQRTSVPSGSTLVLSGFKQLQNQTGETSMFGSKALGGSAAQKTSIETILLITPTILRSDR
jgi:type II secretory pathway component GspD/PulD (secretin)